MAALGHMQCRQVSAEKLSGNRASSWKWSQAGADPPQGRPHKYTGGCLHLHRLHQPHFWGVHPQREGLVGRQAEEACSRGHGHAEAACRSAEWRLSVLCIQITLACLQQRHML